MAFRPEDDSVFASEVSTLRGEDKDRMQLSVAVNKAAERLRQSARGDTRRDAETLLMHALDRDRAYLFTHPDASLSRSEMFAYEGLVDRRAKGEPLQYITGHQEFWGLDLLVTKAVLIPRPETEHAVEAALEILRSIENPHIVDVGTGSGCIALALASELPHAKIAAVDISIDALSIAKQNAIRLNLDRPIEFAQSDLLASYADSQPAFDMVISNPPYVGEREAEKLQVEVREHEPHCALFGGAEGMDIYRRLIPEAHRLLKPGGWLVMEIGYSQEQAIRELLSEWHEVHAVADLQGIPRVVVAEKI